MAKNLVIVESPAKAKTIEKFLGKDFVVKASYGHVRDLPKSDKAIDIENGFKPNYEVIDDKKTVISELKKLAKGSEVYLATDEDREGEAISWHLAEVLGLDVKKTKRIVYHEISKKALQTAMANPRTIDMHLVDAQQARRILDRLVGFQISPILWSKIRTGLSAGRVQSVAVRLIVEREREVNAFTAESSFKVSAEFQLPGNVKLKAELPEKFKTEKEAEKFLKECIDAKFTITNLETKPAKRSPAAPFTTSTLQQEASRKLSFSVAQTMRVAQGLYENGFITYMRTDSVNLSEEATTQAKNVITKEYGKEFHQFRQFKSKIANAQEAHEAIRPTDFSVENIEGERNEVRLYELIRKRALASQMADALLEKTTATISISTSPRTLVASGEVMKFEGFLKLYIESSDEEKEDETENGVLPPLKIGQVINLNWLKAQMRYSRPPSRYTEASLVKKLEELGIGRPSTYAPTISTVQKRLYVVKEDRDGTPRVLNVVTLENSKISHSNYTEITGAEKSKMFPTDLGMMVSDFLVENFPGVVDFLFTAGVEEEFDQIANGEIKWNKMIGSFYKDFAKTVLDTKENAARVAKDTLLGTHPVTKEEIWSKFGRYGAYVQIGANEDISGKKPKYVSLRKGQSLETVTLEDAIELLKLPRTLGESKDGEAIKANIGRFGPYIQLGKLFVSIPKEEDVLTVTLTRALELIKLKEEANANKLIREFAEDIQILRGQWGPYLKMRGENIRLPKDKAPESLTLADCEVLFEENKGKPKGRGRFGKKAAAATTAPKKLAAAKTKAKPSAKKPAAKKPAAKKVTAKKPAAKKATAKKKA